MKIMSINDNVALVFDYKAGDTTLIRCDCYFEVKYSGYISERQPMWLDSERSIIDMGDGLFVLNFGGTLLECYGSHRNVISEVIKTFYKDDPAKAIESFDSLFLKIFTTKAQVDTIRGFLSEYGDRVLVHDDGSVEIDGLYLVDALQRANMLVGVDKDGTKNWTYLCVQPIRKTKGYHTIRGGKEVYINEATVLILVKAWYLLNRHLYLKDRVYVDHQIARYPHLLNDLIMRAEKHGQKIPDRLR